GSWTRRSSYTWQCLVPLVPQSIIFRVVPQRIILCVFLLSHHSRIAGDQVRHAERLVPTHERARAVNRSGHTVAVFEVIVMHVLRAPCGAFHHTLDHVIRLLQNVASEEW